MFIWRKCLSLPLLCYFMYEKIIMILVSPCHKKAGSKGIKSLGKGITLKRPRKSLKNVCRACRIPYRDFSCDLGPFSPLAVHPPSKAVNSICSWELHEVFPAAGTTRWNPLEGLFGIIILNIREDQMAYLLW